MKKINQKRAGMYGGLVSGSHTRETKLDEINRVINWGPIEKILQKEMPRNPNAVGNPAYPAIIMFDSVKKISQISKVPRSVKTAI